MRDWLATNTSSSDDWPVAELLEAKWAQDVRISVVVPARNEERTIADVVTQIRRDLVESAGLVDELVVMDSLSSDRTAEVARASGATVRSVGEVRPELGVRAGKGEAMWKSLFTTTGDLIAFIDADLTEWGPHFVTGLLGPMLARPEVSLVKGFYDRIFNVDDQVSSTEGGRVTELVARPLLALWWPELAGIVQPLAGEWAVRRSLISSLALPTGYGVEMATLLDTYLGHGLGAIAQVDLGRRAHRHQSVHDLGAMAVEILAVADARRAGRPGPRTDAVSLLQYDRSHEGRWRPRTVDVSVRPPAASVSPEPADAADPVGSADGSGGAA
jgi:glucosyl-3-phosphoglycerate synthase